MAMEPAAISASPPTKISRVFCTAPESPAARAKGTVSPSDMPITTSRTKLPAVKCFSICGIRGIGLSLRMRFQIFLGAASHILFAAVGELPRGFLERNPDSTPDLDAHRRSNFVDTAGLIPQKVKADNFEHALTVSPGAHVKILDVTQLGDGSGGQAGLLADLAEGRLRGIFAGVQQSFRQSK